MQERLLSRKLTLTRHMKNHLEIEVSPVSIAEKYFMRKVIFNGMLRLIQKHFCVIYPA